MNSAQCDSFHKRYEIICAKLYKIIASGEQRRRVSNTQTFRFAWRPQFPSANTGQLVIIQFLHVRMRFMTGMWVIRIKREIDARSRHPNIEHGYPHPSTHCLLSWNKFGIFTYCMLFSARCLNIPHLSLYHLQQHADKAAYFYSRSFACLCVYFLRQIKLKEKYVGAPNSFSAQFKRRHTNKPCRVPSPTFTIHHNHNSIRKREIHGTHSQQRRKSRRRREADDDEDRNKNRQARSPFF